MDTSGSSSSFKDVRCVEFETEPGDPFITNFDTPELEIQKQGHGALVETPGGEWYYASLCGRPWHHENEVRPTHALVSAWP